MNHKKILILEDDFLNRRVIKKVLTEKNYFILESKNLEEAITYMANEAIDLAIIDINLGDDKEGGVSLGHHIKDNYDIPFIYLTAYHTDEIIEHAIATVPYSYLTKPFKNIDLVTCVEIALRQYTKKEPRHFVSVKDGEYNVELPAVDIDYIESDGNYLILFCGQKTYKCRSTMKEIMDRLPVNMFLQTHRAFAVNKAKIEKFSQKNVVVNNKVIPVSKRFSPFIASLQTTVS
jgi:DNA-binding LytR/AlgR family response regulator